METPEKEDDFPIRPYTSKELAVKYKTAERTFRRWMVELRPELGKRIGHFYNPRQVRIIIEKLGRPIIVFFSIGAKALMGQPADGDPQDEQK